MRNIPQVVNAAANTLGRACVDNTTWSYLINPQAPAPKITCCRGDVQPFAR